MVTPPQGPPPTSDVTSGAQDSSSSLPTQVANALWGLEATTSIIWDSTDEGTEPLDTLDTVLFAGSVWYFYTAVQANESTIEDDFPDVWDLYVDLTQSQSSMGGESITTVCSYIYNGLKSGNMEQVAENVDLLDTYLNGGSDYNFDAIATEVTQLCTEYPFPDAGTSTTDNQILNDISSLWTALNTFIEAPYDSSQQQSDLTAVCEAVVTLGNDLETDEENGTLDPFTTVLYAMLMVPIPGFGNPPQSIYSLSEGALNGNTTDSDTLMAVLNNGVAQDLMQGLNYVYYQEQYLLTGEGEGIPGAGTPPAFGG